FGELCPLGFASREVTYRRQDFAVVVARREAVQYFMNLRHHPRRASPANCKRFRHELPRKAMDAGHSPEAGCWTRSPLIRLLFAKRNIGCLSPQGGNPLRLCVKT